MKGNKALSMEVLVFH